MFCSPSLTGTQHMTNQVKRITKYMHITLLLDTTQTSVMYDFVHIQCREVD